MPDVIKVFLPLIIEMASKAADALIADEKLPANGKMAILSAYYLLGLWGVKFAADTETEYDDMAVREVMEFLAETAKEAGLDLPVIVPVA